ncbi:MAG: nucleotide exchange factor GrpE [Leptospiraceae bacterium]|nr:nucleotide exchange factor GrpE [Leptospiraceae bacterium]MCB1302655.1 nucleotide exchange factor GrpE [Leptospiraceae bacterium]
MDTQENTEHQEGQFGRPDEQNQPVDGQVDETAEAAQQPAQEGDPLEAARKEIQELKDQWTRERAEFVNFRKRTQDEMARSRIFAVVNFVKGLIPVLDNLELVLRSKSDNPEVKNFVTGVEMIRNEFISVLSRENIKPVVEPGDAFDPNFMEALDLAQDPSVQKDTVTQVYEKGWVRQDGEDAPQVIRPARVQVAKAAAPVQAGSSENAQTEAGAN